MTPTNQTMMIWGAIIVSVMTSITFLIAFAAAYLSKDQTNLSLLVGAVISQFSVVVSFWLGSSAGSQKKDEIVAAAAQKPTPTP